MKNPIQSITINREGRASRYGYTTNTRVYMSRKGKSSGYETTPILEDGKISHASVLRAKRAQLVLLEQSKERSEKE
jgi:hypothetical protein